MDLRVKRTQKSIKDAFYQLRKKKSLEKISVKELSELAMINKATFYLHYHDIYDLSSSLESELIGQMIDELREFKLQNGAGEMLRFSEALRKTILSHLDEIDILFSGFSNNHFINHLEDRLKDYIFSTFDGIRNDEETNIILTFFIQGSYHTHIRNRSVNLDVLEKTTSQLFSRILLNTK
ncbi:MAG: TetR/AcrR family transcriptional regulator [Ruminococcus sp.]|nr:TetR/AcrR family transcriptional regulator [Ruminococcus sp.]